MWLLECLGSDFAGKRLWLRPGKSYLFGRTVTESGQIGISHKTISRKHLTITVGEVGDGDALDPAKRSHVTIEDLATKTGTTIDGKTARGSKVGVASDSAILRLGHYPVEFRLLWRPVVLALSPGPKELQSDPVSGLRRRFEQLDIKLLTEYDRVRTTHVVHRKRNTSKGLLALIDGKYLVADSFLDAVEQVAQADGNENSPLETDFDASWPSELAHLPPRGNEPSNRPVECYEPDPERQEIFDGYTFVFYDKLQFDNLLAPITHAKGKALFQRVSPQETTVDDFVRFVKMAAGEKGVGSLEDGSEGKGVVLVRYAQARGEAADWYARFFRDVSLRLDHRPIEQAEFLEAILAKESSMLRRPLQVADASGISGGAAAQPPPATQPGDPTPSSTQRGGSLRKTPPESLPARWGRGREPIKRRFAGFDDDIDMEDAATDSAPATVPEPEPEPEPALSRTAAARASPQATVPVPEEPEPTRATRQTERKRTASSYDQPDLMEGIMPTAAARKRQRIAAGEDVSAPRPREPTPAALPAPASDPPSDQKKAKAKKDATLLEVARQKREESEARARADRAELARLPEGVDLAAIRRLAIVEEIGLRAPAAPRSREHDVASGRWDPRWNGRQNFKKFKRRGGATGATLRTVVSLTEAKRKDFGLGKDYLLEDSGERQQRVGKKGVAGRERTPQATAGEATPTPSRGSGSAGRAVPSTSEAETDMSPPPRPAPPVRESTPLPLPEPSQGRSTRSRAIVRSPAPSRLPSQSEASPSPPSAATRGGGSRSKRLAASPAGEEQPAKKSKATPRITMPANDGEEEDSDDNMRFKFARRRC